MFFINIAIYDGVLINTSKNKHSGDKLMYKQNIFYKKRL